MPKIKIDLEADSSKFESKLSQLSSKMKSTFSQKFGATAGGIGAGGAVGSAMASAGKSIGVAGIAAGGSVLVAGKSLSNALNKTTQALLKAPDKSSRPSLNQLLPQDQVVRYRQLYAKEQNAKLRGTVGLNVNEEIELDQMRGDRKRLSNEYMVNQLKAWEKQQNDNKGFWKKDRSISGGLSSMGIGSGIIGAGAGMGIGLAIGKLVTSTIAYSDKLQDLSEQSGLAIQDIDALGKSAAGGGKSFEDANKMLNELAASRNDALSGNEDKIAAFSRMGITQDQLANTDNVAKLLGGVNMSDPGNRSSMTELVGKRNVGTFSVMQQDLADWDNFKKNLSESGRLVDPAAVANVAEFKDTLREIGEGLMTSVLPVVSNALRSLLDLWYDFSDQFAGVGDAFVSVFGMIVNNVVSFVSFLGRLAAHPFQSMKDAGKNWDKLMAEVNKNSSGKGVIDIIADAQSKVGERQAERITRRERIAKEAALKDSAGKVGESADEINKGRQKNMDAAIKENEKNKTKPSKAGDELQKFLFGNKDRTLSGLAGVAAGTNLSRLNAPMNDSVSILKMIEKNTRDD